MAIRTTIVRKRGHLAYLAVADAGGDLLVGPVEVVQIRPFIAVCIWTVAVRAVFQEQGASDRGVGFAFAAGVGMAGGTGSQNGRSQDEQEQAVVTDIC